MRQFFCLLLILFAQVAAAQESKATLDGPFLGARCEPLADSQFEIKTLSKESLPKFGLVIRDIDQGGPAAQGALEPLDIVSMINNKPTRTLEDLAAALRAVPKDTQATVAYLRAARDDVGQYTWKRATTKVSLVTLRQYIMDNLEAKTDEEQGVTTYESKIAPELGKVTAIVPYFVKNKEGQVSIRLRIQYAARDWLFIKKITIKSDSQNLVVIEPREITDVQKAHAAGSVWEWYDVPVDAETMSLLKNITKAKKTLIRLEGKQMQKEHVLTEGQRRFVMFMMLAYDVLKA